MNISGWRVVVKPPYKVWDNYFGLCKSKVGKRRIKIWKHVGWSEFIEDGTVIKDGVNHIMYVNQKTYNEIKRKVEHEQRLYDSRPPVRFHW